MVGIPSCVSQFIRLTWVKELQLPGSSKEAREGGTGGQVLCLVLLSCGGLS